MIKENASELANIARELGADIIDGNLVYPSDTGGWQLGTIDLTEYLARFKDKRLMLIVTPVEDSTAHICGICGFVMNEAMECPRCKIMAEDTAIKRQERLLLDEVRDLLGEDDEETPV